MGKGEGSPQMKASNILLEAPERIHIFGEFDNAIQEDGKWKVTRYCALGLLRCKGGYYRDDTRFRDTVEALSKVGISSADINSEKFLACPICKTERTLWNIIVHLNDGHEATFSTIGKFLKGLGY